MKGLRSGKEVGPYLVRASLTEYNEVAERVSDGSGFSLGWLGGLAAIAGAIAGENGLLWSGIGVAAADPGYHETSTRTVGMVGLDVQIIDYRSDRIVASFSASGRFISDQEQSSVSVLGIGTTSERSASSALGQAQRIALNEVAQKTLQALEADHGA
jgi:curli biogenesis system outer membrane secretion channel CsgG